MDFARRASDQAMVDQIGVATSAVRLASATARVALILTVETREETLICKDTQCLVSALRAQRADYTTRTAHIDLGAGNVSARDEEAMLILPMDLQQINHEIRESSNDILARIIDHWTRDLMELILQVGDMCPNWQPFSHALFDPANAPIVKSLLENPQFKFLSPIAEALQDMLKHIRALQADGYGAVVDAQQLKQASGAKSMVVDTICVTWALFTWHNDIKTQRDAKVRSKLVLSLRSQMDERGCPRPSSLAERLDQAIKQDFVVELPSEASTAAESATASVSGKRRKRQPVVES